MTKLSIIPKKSLGQNFLVNPRILDKIVSAAEITKDDVILEVGPGTGSLTKKLLEKAKKVIAIEKDRRLVSLLKEDLKDYKNLEITENDILKFRVESLKLRTGEYKIVANLPYYITSRFLRKILGQWPRPKLIVLTIQKEVAQRIIAKPPKMNLLAVSVQFFSEPKIIGYISKENFRPRPKVDSAIIKLTPINQILNSEQIIDFFKLIKISFSNKRKQIKNNLQKILGKNTLNILKKADIDSESRAEELSIRDWLKIFKSL